MARWPRLVAWQACFTGLDLRLLLAGSTADLARHHGRHRHHAGNPTVSNIT
jgi:hypothetical protein